MSVEVERRPGKGTEQLGARKGEGAWERQLAGGKLIWGSQVS